ncbi:MAG: hypothetical protein HZB10_00245 [Candidatus Yonathbacteria bacterium]|nr:hypothetical protein [Candidatus Yonathbacteria bacterium]
MSDIQCCGAVTATIKFSGVSPEGLQRLHDLVLEKENVMPQMTEDKKFSFNDIKHFVEIKSAKLETEASKYGYTVSLGVSVFDARHVDNRECHEIFYAPIPRDLLLKVFLAVNPGTVPETFEYVARE